MMKPLQDEIAELKAAVAALSGITIEGYNKTRNKGGLVFGKGVRTNDPILVPHRTVVIAALPVAGDTTLTVREAKYADTPPKPCLTGGSPPVTVCAYAWYGDPFEVYPPLGKEAADYAGDEAPTDDSNPPALTTVFHRCHREHEVWVLDLQAEGGGGGMRPARVTAAVTGASTITVQPVKRSGITWVSDGATIVVPLWGFQKGDDFQTFLGGVTVFDVIPLVQVGGEWYAMQYFWMYAKTPNATITKGDCGL